MLNDSDIVANMGVVFICHHYSQYRGVVDAA